QLSGTTTVYIVLAFVGLLLALIVLVIVRIRNRIKSKDSTPSVIGNPDASTASTFVQIPPVTGPTPNIPTVPLPQIQPIPSQQNPIPMQENPAQFPNVQPPQPVDQPVQTTQVNQETVQPNITPTVTLTSQPQSPTQVESNPQPIPPQSQI